MSRPASHRLPPRARGRSGLPLDLARPLDGDAVVEAQTAVGTLWLDRHDRLTTPSISATGTWEPNIEALLRRALRPGMTFVDVGANVGYFSVLAGSLVAPGGTVIALEPEPTTAAILRANLWRNGCDGAHVLEMAAYSRRTHIRMVAYPDARAGSWVDESSVEGLMVPCAPLDQVLVGESVDLIKIDAEGLDHLVVRGLEATLRRCPGVLVITELWTQQERGGERAPAIVARYRERGLAVTLLGEGGGLTPLDDALLERTAAAHQIVNVVLQPQAAGDGRGWRARRRPAQAV